jgi:hypothetical protein
MKVEHVEALVEDASTEAALAILLPKMLGDISFRLHAHQSKQDLLNNILARFRGYASWLPRNWRLLVLVDRDREECVALKRRLDAAAAEAGLKTRTTVGPFACAVINRIAIEELEAWYLATGMLFALHTHAFPRQYPTRLHSAIRTPSPEAPGKPSSACSKNPDTSRAVYERSKSRA